MDQHKNCMRIHATSSGIFIVFIHLVLEVEREHAEK